MSHGWSSGWQALKKKKLANFVLCSDKRVNAAVCICNSMLTSGLDPSKAMERFWHSCLRSATPKEEKRDVRSMEGLTGWAELAPVICRPRRILGIVDCCWERVRNARNEVERGTAMMSDWKRGKSDNWSSDWMNEVLMRVDERMNRYIYKE